ncbi:4'-phosphopantetheinyl transferase [Aphanothece hegewaldii CCALA 016]|uniref:4'-phosphopantetheinyl transferase n=1 Tax=Aphanothece hegewaldii CCALA 016 TaxID=2107694 RepID=A0A2T1LX43_9CHRO|nr:4'-phosphopantetheinyl transferase superfamily protein [Aphanothece hegewaldii]PSF36760.1 4'-phosphopantetheinyl transferase [Aphanothece hegewaldii CCALA 016]
MSHNLTNVQIWVNNLDQPSETIQNLEKILSEDEKERAMRFRFAEHRRRFIVARGGLREILGHYLNLAPQDVRFEYNAKGKPFLCSSLNRELQFNVSHSHELALYGVAQSSKIGVDLEYVRTVKDLEHIAERFFCPSEAAIVKTLSSKEKEKAFFKIWTAKEAYLKATGEGIAGGLNQVEVSISKRSASQRASGQFQGLKSIAGDEQAVNQWRLWSFFPKPDYVATIAVEDVDRVLSWKIFDWNLFDKNA